MFLRKLFVLALMLCTYCVASAHAIWVETNATGKKGQKQAIKVYFGEFGDKDITKADKWFSDLKDFTLTLIAPDGTESKLTSAAADDHYASSFTPDQNGVYTVAIQHAVKDVYHDMKLVYHTSATVVVGNEFKGNTAEVNKNLINIFSDSAFAVKQNKVFNLKAFNASQPAKSQEVEVVAPNGWGKKLWAAEDGTISFTPIWPGKYMAEFSHAVETPGEHNGKPYKQVYNVATYVVAVK